VKIKERVSKIILEQEQPVDSWGRGNILVVEVAKRGFGFLILLLMGAAMASY